MTTLETVHQPSAAEPEVRRVATGDLRWALDAGWRDFVDRRGDLLFAGLLYPLIGFLAWAIAADTQLLPLFFPMVAGLSLLGPVVTAGFYELARRRERGEEAGWRHFLDPLRDARRGTILSLAGGLVVLFLAWLIVAWALYQSTVGALAPTGVREFLDAVFTTPQGWTLIVLGNLAGAVLALATLVVTVVACPMAVDRAVDPATAVRTSIRAVSANRGAMLRWGLWVAALLVVGAIPLLIGLAVVLPVLGYATWHLYTRLVVR